MKRVIIALVFVVSLLVASATVLAAETANLSGYGIATADSYTGENSIALAAVDGVLDGYCWTPTKSVNLDSETGVYKSRKPAWFQVKFEIPTEISSSKIYWAKERAAEGYFKLLYSDDGENWTEVSNFSSTRQDGAGSVTKPIIDTVTFDPVKAKFFMLEISAGETKGGVGSIYEFELYGDEAQYDYLKKSSGNEDSDNEDVKSDPKNNGDTLTYVVVGVGIVIVLVCAFVVLKTLKKGDGKNA